jgi:cytochrome c-type biogenesis protein CcmH
MIRQPDGRGQTARRLVAALVTLAALAATEPAGAEEASLDERHVEERLLAPCCWRETLATHDSPLARELRAEVRSRLARGDAPEAIRASLVERYGARIRAVPEGLSLGGLGLGFFGVAVLGGAALLARRVPRRAVAPAPVEAPVSPEWPESREWEDRLDDELEALER